MEIERKLKADMPGWASQSKMSPRPRPGQKPYAEVESTCLKAGVMLILIERGGSWQIVFIRRTHTVLHHKDQISFPGGQVEPGESFVQAALRETQEEIGIETVRLRVLGALTPLYIPPSNFCIYPFVSTTPVPDSYVPRPDEVVEVIEIPLLHLMDPANVRQEVRTVRGERVEVPYYAYKQNKVWGATAMVLAEFIDILRARSA